MSAQSGRVLLALAVCLLAAAPAAAGDGNAGAWQASSGTDLLEKVRAELWAAEDLYRNDPEEGREALRDLAASHPAHLISCLLDRVVGLAIVNPATGLMGRPRPRRDFVRDALEAIDRAEGYRSVPGIAETYEALAASGGREWVEAWGRISRHQDLEGLDEAVETFRRERDPLGTCRALQARGEEHLRRGEAEEAAADFREAGEAAEQARDRFFEARARLMQAIAEESAENPLVALESFDLAGLLAEGIADAPLRFECLRGSGRVLLEMRRPLEALDRFSEALSLRGEDGPSVPALKLALAEGAAAGVAAARQMIEAGAARTESIEEIIERGTRWAIEAGEETTVARYQVLRAELLVRTGARAEAVVLLRDALEVFRMNADDPGMLDAASRLGALLERERPGEAVGFYREAAEAAAATGEEVRVGELLARSAELARRSGLKRLARRSLSLAVSGELAGPLTLEAQDRLNLTRGHLALQEGEAAEALAAYARVPGRTELSREARWGEAAARLRVGQTATAAQAALEALPPGEVPPRALAALALHALDAAGREAEARALAGRLESLTAAGGEASAVRGLLELRAGRREGAQRAVSGLLVSPRAEDLFDAAGLLAALGQRPEARKALERARRAGLDPVLPALDPLLAR